MKSICMYFQVHQPRRLRRIRAFRHPDGQEYWDEATDRNIFERAADKCYLPTNRLLLEAIQRHEGRFRVAFSITGTFIEQARRYRPEVLDSFQELARTGHVEFLAETYYHSLAALMEHGTEFRDQVDTHRRAMLHEFGVRPTTFRNTELIYDDRVAQWVDGMGYDAILAEGATSLLGDRSPNHVYAPSKAPRLRALMKNYRLSDDIAFRFSAHDWPGYPLKADTYAHWLDVTPGEVINLFMDYETFGEHQWAETGIFRFLHHLPDEVLKHEHLRFDLPRDVAKKDPVGTIDAPWPVSWADTERDVSAWLGNRMQQRAFADLKALEGPVRQLGDQDVLHAWRLLQTSDHLYYQTTKHLGDGAVHEYFSPYESPYVAYMNHMNAIQDLRDRVMERLTPIEQQARLENAMVA